MEKRLDMVWGRYADHKTTKQPRSHTRRPGCSVTIEWMLFTQTSETSTIKKADRQNASVTIQSLHFRLKEFVEYESEKLWKALNPDLKYITTLSLWPPRVGASTPRIPFFRPWNCKPDSRGNPKVLTFTSDLWPSLSFLTSMSYRPSVITTFHMGWKRGFLINAKARWPPLRSVGYDFTHSLQ